jgi:Tetratricopeptide repeat
MVEAERIKPRSMFAEEAVALALESKWEDALGVNEQLVNKHGPDEDAYNRMGKALTELGRLPEAIDCYRKTLELNQTNTIAQKNLHKLAVMSETKERLGSAAAAAIDVDLFTEEPGKSALTVLSTTKKAASVSVAPGDVVNLEPDDNKLNARTVKGVLLGQIDTKIARRLLMLIKTGNRYSAAVARVSDEQIEVMIREEYQSSENVRRSSFPVSAAAKQSDFRPYAKESLLSSRETDSPTARDDEDSIEPEALIDEGDTLEGMRTVEGEVDDDLVEVADDDEEVDIEDDDEEEDTKDDDEDARPEDQY